MGIDPGTNIMGYGIIRIIGKAIDILVFDVIRLEKLDNQPLKLKNIFEKTLALIDTYHPDELAIEAPFFGKNVQSMLKLGRAQGVAIAAALYRDVPVFEYSPRRIKQSITGHGNASKEQLAAMLQHLLSIGEMPAHFDATDALGVALCHYFGKDIPGEGKKSYSGWKAFIAENPGRMGT